LSVTVRSAAGAFVALLFLSGLLHLEVTGVPTVTGGLIYPGLAGGISGRLLASGLRAYFASTGAHIILLAGLTIALLLAVPISLVELSQRVPAWREKIRETLAALIPDRPKEIEERPKKTKVKPVKINRPSPAEEAETPQMPAAA